MLKRVRAFAFRLRHVGDGDLDVHPRLNGDGGDLLDDLRRRVEIDETLVDAHLETIPRVGTLTARGLAGGDPELLGREADRALDLEVLVLGSALEISAHCTAGAGVLISRVLGYVGILRRALTLLKVLHVESGEGDADLVDLLPLLLHASGFLFWGEIHD